jgi:hypothetical protein
MKSPEYWMANLISLMIPIFEEQQVIQEKISWNPVIKIR